MTSTTGNTSRRFAYRYGNPIVECDGAQMRAQSRQLATVVTISGDVDATNIHRVSQYAGRFVIPEKPFVLDLSEVQTFSPEAVSLLRDVEDACNAIGMEWCLIASQAVDSTLRPFGGAATFTTASSVPEALHLFLDATLERRRLLPLLNKTA